MDLHLAVETIATAGMSLTDTCRAAPEAPVPSCPGWSIADLTRHVGQVHTWAEGLLAGDGSAPVGFPEVPPGIDPATWADDARTRLLATMGAADPDRPVWAFGSVEPARFWWRRQANETAVHAWDATAATGTPWAMPDAVATEALEEVLDWFLPRRWGHKPPGWGDGRTVHLHQTDGDGEWLVTIGAPPVVERGHAKGDLAVRGPIVELLLWTMGRVGDGHPAVERLGDETLAEAWTANVRM